ncbi:MAG: sigma-70 family RNA polymerase sigma factor [Chloroflexi bacterium]|nr:MAG: sigma-70 family RNA polymerase sigma factor [Chloroflexota bacterium]
MQTQQARSVEYTEFSDGVLVKQALIGHQEAFETLVHRYSTSLFNFIYHFLGDYDHACDILQQVFLQLFLSLSIIQTDEPIKPWLFQVARNRCLDVIRQQNRRPTLHFSQIESISDEGELPVLMDIPDNNPLPEDIAEHHDIQKQLWQAIQALPPKFRAVVTLRYAGQMRFSEIASVLDMPAATAKTYFQRAKPLLRTALYETARSSMHY